MKPHSSARSIFNAGDTRFLLDIRPISAMGDKQQMVDFASLFLPDLLNPLDSLSEEDRNKLDAGTRGAHQLSNLQAHLSSAPSTSSSDMSLIRFFEASQAASTTEQDSGCWNQHIEQPLGPSLPDGMEGSLYSGHYPKDDNQTSSLGLDNRSGTGNEQLVGGGLDSASSNTKNNPFSGSMHGLLPYLSFDMGHTLHYAEFLAPEAFFQQPQRQRQYHMVPFQLVFPGGPSTQHDNSTWANASDPAAAATAAINKGWFGPSAAIGPTAYGSSPMDRYGSEYYNLSWPGALLKSAFVDQKADGSSGKAEESQNPGMTGSADTPEDYVKPEKAKGAGISAKKKPPKPPLSCSLVPSITVDYSSRALGQLVDLKHAVSANANVVLSSTGRPVNFSLRGFLNGRLMTNNQDNHKYISLTTGSVDVSQTYNPQVISCYRRNFINLHLNLLVDFPTTDMSVHGDPVLRLRVEIDAVSNKTDSKPVILLDNGLEQDQKEICKAGDDVQVEVISPTHTIELAECRRASFWKVKKLHFKNATANNTNLTFQTYYLFLGRLIAETPRGDHVVDEVASNPIIVRGRNPSFYQAKNDIMIKIKSPNVAASYQYSILPMPLNSEIGSGRVPKVEDGNAMNVAPDHREAFLAEERGSLDETYSEVRSKNGKSGFERGPEGSAGDTGEEHADDAETDGSSLPKSKDENAVPHLPSGVDIRNILDSVSEKKGEKYHYFPILNVYYLPPINVVYFPHAAHHTVKSSEESDNQSKASALAKKTGGTSAGERKAGSMVYFR